MEQLGDERFQKLCQALILAKHPDTACLPVNQPDGGRDAFRRSRTGNQTLVVYQVKYSPTPSAKEEREFIEAVIALEREKVERLVRRGATSYYLMTNVAGTAHLDAGSIDRVNAAMTAAFSIPSFCLWRDDIQRAIDTTPGAKWAFPEIIRGVDLLEILVGGENENAVRRTKVLKSFMADQYAADQRLKFKQVDLDKNIEDLFVDVPAFIQSDDKTAQLAVFGDLGRSRWQTHEGSSEEERLAESPGTLEILVNPQLARRLSMVVIEGAPGQGKSTVTQYLCQIHRKRLLGRTHGVTELPREARVPFRVDLRDYSSWLDGRDPFATDASTKLPPDTPKVLESFISQQVRHATGQTFTSDDFVAVAGDSQMLVVLDGFDEVADTVLRGKIIEEVTAAATRLKEIAISVQFVVTSRPTAFANSAGFPRDQWEHIRMLSLSKAAIRTYAEKWLMGRATPRERHQVLTVLEEKLQQTHVRDLARNPMQLAILLALISVQGASLPDKRTSLYDRYMDIFFDRESEKSATVRDHRDLLVKLHRYLAWVLHVDAEINAGVGRIDEAEMRSSVREYLEENGYEPGLVDAIFKGMTERVVALVSRVKGTFEFEVQPLREYFAAKYLYDTAPYDPVGDRRNGTLPERFDAIAANFYWLNVARFYAGCYSSGNLASLSVCLDELDRSYQFSNNAHILNIAVTLMADYVFNQQPKVERRVAEWLCESPKFRLLLARQFGAEMGSPLMLPVGAGQRVLIEYCKREILRDHKADLMQALCDTLISNLEAADVRTWWMEQLDTYRDVNAWVEVASLTGVASTLSNDELGLVRKKKGLLDSVWFNLVARNDSEEAILSDTVNWRDMATAVLDMSVHAATYARRDSGSAEFVLLRYLGFLLSPMAGHYLADYDEATTLRDGLVRFYARADFEDKAHRELLGTLGLRPDFCSALIELFNSPVTQLKSDPRPWTSFIEAARAEFGTTIGLSVLAMQACGLQSASIVPSTKSLSDLDALEVDKFALAQLNGNNPTWWQNEIDTWASISSSNLVPILTAALGFMSSESILLNYQKLGSAIDSLTTSDWHELVRPRLWRHRTQRQRTTQVYPSDLSPRLAACWMRSLTPSSALRLARSFAGRAKEVPEEALLVFMDYLFLAMHRSRRAWPQLAEFTKAAYSRGVVPPRVVGGGRSNRWELGDTEANVIMTNPDEYPLRIVETAERTLLARAGGLAKTLGSVSTTEGWFKE
ncbi:hypothetical protein [Devosia sp. DBB001]|nr:hypothetical protein [Devosia sp. DBB001]